MSKFQAIIDVLNDRLGEVVIGLNNMADAQRAHTQYCREADELDREEDKKDVDPSADTFERADVFRVVDIDAGGVRPGPKEIYETTVNMARRAHGLPEAEPGIPEHVVNLMRETPHMYVRKPFGGPRTSPSMCKLCLLTFGNPVHLIEMASLRED